MRRGRLILVLALICGAIGTYAGWPRKADLRAFDPAGMARLETAMWRDYYEKHYPRLFYHLYELSRTQFGFSPLDSFRIARNLQKLQPGRLEKDQQEQRDQEVDSQVRSGGTYHPRSEEFVEERDEAAVFRNRYRTTGGEFVVCTDGEDGVEKERRAGSYV